MIVADASVVLKWFFPHEENYEISLVLKRRHAAGEEPIAAPDLLLYEVANTLLIKRGEVRDSIEGFLEFCEEGVELHSFGPSEFTQAMQLAHRYELAIHDASYVALAQALGCRFVTADERLLSRLKGVPRILHLKEFADD